MTEEEIEVVETLESTVPWKGDGEFDWEKAIWKFECAFCDFTCEFRGRNWAIQEMMTHGRKHYDRRSGLYKNAAGLEESRRRHREYKAIMGDQATTNQMNREGL